MRVRTRSGPVLLGAVMVYMIPLLLFFAGYLVLLSRNLGFLGGLLGFALGLALAAVYDRKIVKKNKPQYTIIGY